VVAELCDPVVEDVEGALETEGDEALGVTAGTLEIVTEGEEGDEALGVGAVAADGVLGVTAGVTAGAAVTDELGVPVVYVTFFTTPMIELEK
jgi:hypothetical protein